MRTSNQLLSCLLLVAAAGAAHAAADAHQEVFERYVQALNSADVDSTLAVFTDDATLVAGPGCTPQNPCVGKAQIRARFVEPMVAQRLRLRPVGYSGNAQEMRVALELQHDAFKKQGFETLKGIDEVRMRDGRIASVVFRFDPTDPPTARYMEAYRASQAAGGQGQGKAQ